MQAQSDDAANPTKQTRQSYIWHGLTPKLDNIPAALRAIDQWVLWRAVPKLDQDGALSRMEKIPVQPNGRPASSTDPNTWCSFAEALAAYEEADGDIAGLGFVLTSSDAFVALDFDHVGDSATGGISDAVWRAVDALGAYAEWSPSGTGARIVGTGSIPAGAKNGAVLQHWEHSRFITITGHRLNDKDVAEFDPDTLAKVVSYFNPTRERPRPGGGNGSSRPVFDIAGAVADVLSGDNLHDSLRDLAASMAAASVPEHVVRGLLQGVLDNSLAKTATPGRWEARKAEIDKLVSSAMEKFEPADGWPDVEPLGAAFSESLTFPVRALPDLMRDAVTQYAAFGKQPLAMIASSAIAAASVATQGLYDVARDGVLIGPISLSFLSVGDSGERKSAADNVMGRGLRRWQDAYRQQALARVKVAKGEHRSWAAKMRGLERLQSDLVQGKVPVHLRPKKGEQQDPNLAEVLLAKAVSDIVTLEATEPVIPSDDPKILYQDTTIEGLIKDLSRGRPSAAMWEDEAGVIFGSVAMSADRLLGMVTGLNKLWDAKSLSQNRASVESRNSAGKRFTVNLMVQGGILAKLAVFLGGTARTTGFLARFLICSPPSTMGTRLYTEPTNMGQVDAFATRIEYLLDQPLPLSQHSEFELDPPVLVLSPPAKAIWREYHDEVERDIAPQVGDLESVADFASKSAEQAARIAGVFSAFEGNRGVIDQDVMQNAVLVARWYLTETLRVFGLYEVPQGVQDALGLFGWMVRQGAPSFTSSEVAQRCFPRALRSDKVRRSDALVLLCGEGYLKLTKDGKARTYHVNPEASV